MSLKHGLLKAAWTALALTAMGALSAQAADNIGDVRQPLWYKPPSERVLKLAKIDDLSHTVVSVDEQGNEGVLASTLKITDEQAAKIKAGHFTAAISMGWLGDDWATQQLLGLNKTLESVGIKVIATTNANWSDAKQISDLEAISVLKPDLLLSIPLNEETTANAFQKIAKQGTKIVFMDQDAKGMLPGKDFVGTVSSDNLTLGMYIADMLAKSIGGKGDVGALYFANDFHVTNLRYIGFIARLKAKYPDIKLVTTAGFDDPDKGQVVSQALFARYPTLAGLYGSWSIPAMGAVTSAKIAGRSPKNFSIVCENFDQIVAANMAENGFIKGISTQRPYDQGVAEATMGALSLIGAKTPKYAVVPPLAVTRDDLAQSYQTIYRKPLPEELLQDLKTN